MWVWYLLFLSCFPGLAISGGGVVTLESIKIYNSHEWIKSVKPIVYFSCKGENNTELPDVNQLNFTYTFKGQESWQPLTEFTSTKCKRCGFYERDTFKSDDVFDEWEFCPSDFDTDGKYSRAKLHEFDASFFCPHCLPLASADSNSSSASSPKKGKGMHIAVAILVTALVSTLFLLGLLAVYKYWQKKKREQDQARFLKLFEDGDDIEDELGLGSVL
ncbi:uncharacterized protein LOC8283859 [Ricinus communis]|uniref:DUF7953 domain-containing protein n=1 Tax=Ricinus communis TaxID=3988 RepID=B9SGU9_RICCO|nr:uncharacterized protein LOC8283859 [Ricinus communis]EEF37184.1 conserved hypothetical protein [Ricinus communis]|eukprot:XP_002525218.1 uncharacterized protein LOC8283859 [Ricinus communis]